MTFFINCWIETIIQPVEPPETAAETNFDLYSFRKGAQLYFTGAKVESASSDNKESMTKKLPWSLEILRKGR